MNIVLSFIFSQYEISIIDTLTNMLYNESFDEFESSLKMFYGKVDTNILRCIKLGFLELYMTDNSTDYRYGEFVALLDTLMNLPQNNTRNKLYVAVSSAVGAVFYGRRGNITKAISLGNISFNLFNEIYSENPDVYDAYLPMGIYHFAMGYLSRSSSRKKMGISMVKESAKRGILVKLLSYAALVYMYVFDKKPGYAVNYALKALELYPKSRTFRWILAYAYKEAAMYKDAIGMYREILTDLKERNPNCKVCLAEVYLYLGESYKALGDGKMAQKSFWSSHYYANSEKDPYRQRKVKEILKKLAKYGIRG